MSTEPDPPRRREANLAAGADAGLDRAVLNDLNAIRAESMLARQDAVNELQRDMNAAPAAPLDLAEMTGLRDRLDVQSSQATSVLEGLLASPETSGLTMERGLLSELLKEGAESQQVLKTGLVFCRNRRHAEAVEWWTLHRRNLDPKTSRLYLLLLVMESLTHSWAGDRARAEAAREQVRAHPLCRALRPNLDRREA